MTSSQRLPTTEVLFGVHPVTEALAARRRRVWEVYMAVGKRTAWEPSFRQQALKAGIPITPLPLSDINRLARSRLTQGVAAKVSPYPVVGARDIVAQSPSGKTPPFLLVADGVMDTGNLGALIRTGVCMGVTGVVVPKDRCAPPTPAVSRASAGALEHARMARVTNLVRAVEGFKERGIWVYGLDPEAKTPLFSVDLDGPLALVVGGEAKGIRSLLKRRCDGLVSIPQKGRLNSLNVSVAGGIAMYTVFLHRMHAAP
jgi:23S rRNA (guanosine2251-2'-O)-methyltransferase